MKKLLVVMLFVGILFIVIDIVRENNAHHEKIIYRYIPRTFEEEQNEPVYVSEIFQTMFTQPSIWVRDINDYNDAKKREINKFFISQS
jgi:hypothetical protein